MKFKITAERIAIFLLASLVVVLLVDKYTGLFAFGIDKNVLGQKVIDYINTYLVEPGTKASLIYVTDKGSFYEVLTEYQNNRIPVYVSKDGKYLFLNVFELTQAPINQQTQVSIESLKLPELDSQDPTIGNGSRILIFEYTDYQCPFCARHSINTFPKILSNYLEKGYATYIFKDFPLSFHPYAMPAAKYANCVYKNYGKEKYLEFKDWIFENQDQWSNSNYKEVFENKIAELGMDKNVISSCVNDSKIEEEINNDLQEVNYYGLGGTPSFVIALSKEYVNESEINEIRNTLGGYLDKIGETENYWLVIFSGALPFEVFDSILSKAL